MKKKKKRTLRGKVFRCRKCRTVVAEQSSVLPHFSRWVIHSSFECPFITKSPLPGKALTATTTTLTMSNSRRWCGLTCSRWRRPKTSWWSVRRECSSNQFGGCRRSSGGWRTGCSVPGAMGSWATSPGAAGSPAAAGPPCCPGSSSTWVGWMCAQCWRKLRQICECCRRRRTVE